MVFGTFDNLHPGHLSYFAQAYKLGQELIVIVARDRNVQKIKGRLPREKEKDRVKNIKIKLKELGYKNKVVLGSSSNNWLVLKKYQPNIICLGYDQTVDLRCLRDKLVKFRLFCKVKRLKPYHPEKYKSSYFRGSD